MDLSRQLLKDFADVTRGVEREQTQYLRGTIKGSGETKYVRIDGSESLTPISEVVDVKEGDRVLVTIENHEATILGNLTKPPSAYKEQEAIDKAEDAQESAEDASNKAENAQTLAKSASDKADAATLDATNASASATKAKQDAAEALTAAGNASTKADEAKNLATTAGQNAATAREEAALAQNAATAAQGEVTRIEGVVTGVKGDIDTALKEVADQAADLQATKETLEVTYAKKTEVSDVQAALTTEISKKVGELQTTVSQTYAAKNDVVAMEGRLQSQITQTSGEVSSVVGKVEQLESDTTEAKKKVDEALEKSAAAQVAAGQAQANATAAQTAADAAKANADNATKKANEAVQNAANAAATAAEADRKVSAAKTDLDEAKVNLENTMNRVGATEQEIADAQKKVDAAQAAVTQAQKEAAEATLAANNAQSAANQAQTDATEAQNAATNAQKKADNAALAAGNAQAAADKAQQDVAALTERVTSAETAITQNAEQIKLAATKTEEIGNKVDSLKLVGENLILNGYGEFGNNKNFTNYIFDGTNSYNNKPSFKTSLKTTLSIGSNRIPIDIDKAYQFSMNIKSDNGGKIYLGWDEYDIDGYYISPSCSMGYPNTTTALAKDLNNGDTVVYLESTANWVYSDYTHQNGLIFWNYRDSTGYLYPEGVYSRNVWLDLYTKETVDKTNNTITLKSSWTHGTIKAGTRVSQSNSQGHKYRNYANSSAPTSWTNTSFRIGEDHRSQSPYSFDANRFSPAAKSISFMAMWSYGTSVADTYYINSIELKNIDDKLLIDGINNNLQNNYYSKTQTDAAIKVAADNVTTTVRKEVTTEITNVNNKVDNLQVGGRNLYVQSANNTFAGDVSNHSDTSKVLDNYGFKSVYNVSKAGLANVRLQKLQFNGITHATISFDAYVNTGSLNLRVDICDLGNKIYNISTTKTRYSLFVDNIAKFNNTDTYNGFADFSFTLSEGQTLYVEYIMVEHSTTPSNHTPAPEDQQFQVDNIQVGGRNLLKDTVNFHNNGRPSGSKDGWLDSYHSTIESEKYNGLTVRSLKNVTTAKEMCNYYFTGFNLGDTYTLSFWAKGTINKFRCYFYGDSGYVKARAINASIPYVSGSTYADGFCAFVNPKITNWTRISVTWELDSVGDINIAKRVLIRTDGATSGDLYVCGVKLEKGNKATDWTPAPEDMATADQAQQAQNDANEANGKADATENRVSVAESTIKQLSDSISMLVTDSNGSSMMTQTSNGWTFNIGSITNSLNNAVNNLDNLTGSVEQTNSTLNNLKQLADDLSNKTAYINMSTDEITGLPCIELGKGGDPFKVRITNRSVDFMDGESKIAYVSNQTLYINQAVVRNEFMIGDGKGFVFKTRSNGNMGLRWSTMSRIFITRYTYNQSEINTYSKAGYSRTWGVWESVADVRYGDIVKLGVLNTNTNRYNYIEAKVTAQTTSSLTCTSTGIVTTY